jgi:hypothetical protein
MILLVSVTFLVTVMIGVYMYRECNVLGFEIGVFIPVLFVCTVIFILFLPLIILLKNYLGS